MSNFFNPIIGISTGDPNGIGIEVILKSLNNKEFIKNFIPIIFSNYRLIESQKIIFNIKCKLQLIENVEEAKIGQLNILNTNDEDLDVNFGMQNEAGGKFSRDSLMDAVNNLKDNNIHALVTAPINKNNIQNCVAD